jgi:hypothetical protein
MAGRLRIQLKKLEPFENASAAPYDQIAESAPAGIITPDSYGDWLDGQVTEPKADRWHRMADGVLSCYQSANELIDMLHERIEKLPTYRPPAATAA